MPRRSSARTVTPSATPRSPAVPQHLDTPYDSNIHHLRRHWKWAAFSQFFFTFGPLLALADVTITEVENDLVHSTNHVLSRIMQRLLITLTQDRKISTDSWQNALRRQYQRRDPQASPIGLIPRLHNSESSRASTAPSGVLSEVPVGEAECENESSQRDQSITPSFDNVSPARDLANDQEHVSVPKLEEEEDSSETLEAPERQPDWLEISMLDKLESLHTLAEWQFQNPHRIRQQMKTDDEQASWRIEPIGYDAKRSAYWLIGGERLWIQREPPRPNLKRKRKPDGNSKNTTKKQSRSLTVKRLRIDPNSVTVRQSSATRSTRSTAHTQLSSSPREGRAAKTRANQRLDAQARDIAEFRRQMASSRTRPTSTSPRKPTGIRVSARLRGTAVEDDEWQEVPDEWLTANDARRKDPPSDSLLTNRKKLKTGLESEDSSISELTQLSDGEDNTVGPNSLVEDTEELDATFARQDASAEIEDRPDDEARLNDQVVVPPGDFVEWETICVTLEEWERIGEKFAKATHYAEKALHKVLSQNIVPMIITELREAEKKKHIEDAVVHRKRSTRIAMREIEKQEERAAVRKRVEEEEKMSRARRLEARHQKEQAERLRRENAREQRRQERESREQQSTETCEAEFKTDAFVDVDREETSSNLLPPGQSKVLVTLGTAPINGTGSGSRNPVENWVLDCEICGRKGVNQDNGVSLMCCGVCGKWQHIVCHDKQDTMAGRPQRNWDSEDFVCQQCRLISPKSSPPYPFTVNGKKRQVSTTHVPPSNHLRSYSDSGYPQESSTNARYPSDLQTTVPSPSTHSYVPESHPTGVTFAHYQPQQGGFSTSRPTYSVPEGSPPQQSRYSISPHTVSIGTTPYPSTVHPQDMAHSPTDAHEQWLPSSYPRTSTNSYTLNGGSSPVSQGVQSFYNGHPHPSYSHVRGATSPGVLGQYAGLRHVPSYQQSK